MRSIFSRALGPFEAEREVLDAIRLPWGPDVDQSVINEAALLAVCADAGVQLGAYDKRILHWMAGWDPQTVAVLAGVIQRAAVRSSPLGVGDV